MTHHFVSLVSVRLFCKCLSRTTYKKCNCIKERVFRNLNTHLLYNILNINGLVK